MSKINFLFSVRDKQTLSQKKRIKSIHEDKLKINDFLVLQLQNFETFFVLVQFLFFENWCNSSLYRLKCAITISTKNNTIVTYVVWNWFELLHTRLNIDFTVYPLSHIEV